MKILQANKFYYELGGSEHYLFQLSRLLIEKGHQVAPFAMSTEKNIATEWSKYFPSQVTTDELGWSAKQLKSVLRMFYSLEAKRKMKNLLNNFQPDICHIHNIYHQISPSILPVLKKRGIPVVMTVHDYKLICPNYILYTKNSVCRRCKKTRYYNAVKYRCLKNSYLASTLTACEMYFHKAIGIYEKNINIFIAPSMFVKNMLAEFGINAEKIAVLPHFIDTENILPEYGKGDGFFLYAGRLKKEKGVDVLIEAMKLLPEAKLKIAGTGPDEEMLKKRVKDLSLKNVDFLGRLDSGKMPEIIKNSRAVIVPSRVWETFGISALEAMAFGKPVIAANIGALPELIEPEKQGLLFQPENSEDLAKKMDWLMKNPDKAEAMGKNARKKAENNYSKDMHYRQLINIYEKAAK